MDLTQLANLGEFIGGVAVLVTLIYLATQVRQANVLAKADALHKTVTIHSAARHMLMDEGTSAIFLKARGDEELSANEEQRLIVLLAEFSYSAVAAQANFRAAGSLREAETQPQVVADIVGQSRTLERIWSQLADELAVYHYADFAAAVTKRLDRPHKGSLWFRAEEAHS